MRKAAKVVGCIITLCLTVGLLLYMTNLTERKSSRAKYSDFFRDKDFDVLFLGTSHMINGVFPMELWNEYGITSYNLGGHASQLATTYWVLENALDYVKPKAVVIDCFTLSSDRKSPSNFSYMHLSFDAFPLSLNKIKAIWDLLDDPVANAKASKKKKRNSEPRTRIGLLWDFSVYHSRWNELTNDDFRPAVNREKGAEMKIAVARTSFSKAENIRKIEPGHMGETYLRRIIELCRQRGIEVMLTYLPYPATGDQQAEANRAYDVAREYEIPYLNFLDIDRIIDFRTDMFDTDSHLNPSGARKITSYIGEPLVKQFNLPDRRNDPNYSYWQQDYQEYEALKNSNLAEQEDIINYLMLLSGDDISTMICLRNSDILKSEWILALLENLGINTSDLDMNTDFILVSNKKYETVVLDDFFGEGKTGKTLFGTASVTRVDSENNGSVLTLTVEGLGSMDIEESSDADMQINVYRHGDLVDSVEFRYTIDPSSDRINTLSATRRK